MIMNRCSFNNDILHKLIDDAYSKFRDLDDGQNASYIPFLKDVDSKLFGISICLTDGTIISKGDTTYLFGLESISKVPTAILALQQYGASYILEHIGSNATGMDFGSLLAILLEHNQPSTPLVNAGAIAACSLIKPIGSMSDKWNTIIQNINALCGSETQVIEDLYKNETDTNFHNRSITWLLKSYNRMYDDPEMSLDIYTRQCSIGVNVNQLAVMAGTIANKGTNPLTKKNVFDRTHAPQIISMMATVGMYQETGDWMFRTGIPAKSGVGGGIIAVYPNVMGIAVFSPKLNQYGNSIRGEHTIKYIVNQLGLSIYE